MVLIHEMTSARRIQDLKRSLLSNACGVVLKESLGKGMGVFATKAFKKDSFVTVYPSHMVGAELDIQCVVWMRNREYTMEYVNKLSKDYCQRIIGGVIAGDPALLEDGLGHMVNDGAAMLYGLGPEVALIQGPAYAAASEKRMNAGHSHIDGSHVVVTATRAMSRE